MIYRTELSHQTATQADRRTAPLLFRFAVCKFYKMPSCSRDYGHKILVADGELTNRKYKTWCCECPLNRLRLRHDGVNNRHVMYIYSSYTPCSKPRPIGLRTCSSNFDLTCLTLPTRRPTADSSGRAFLLTLRHKRDILVKTATVFVLKPNHCHVRDKSYLFLYQQEVKKKTKTKKTRASSASASLVNCATAFARLLHATQVVRQS